MIFRIGVDGRRRLLGAMNALVVRWHGDWAHGTHWRGLGLRHDGRLCEVGELVTLFSDWQLARASRLDRRLPGLYQRHTESAAA